MSNLSKLFGLAFIAMLMSASGCQKTKGQEKPSNPEPNPTPQREYRSVPDLQLKISEFTIDVGATAPFKAIHLTDSHINKIDNRDFDILSARFNKMVSKEDAIYRDVYLMDAVHYAETHDDMLVLHTGDILDMYSEAGLDYIAAIFKRLKNVFACVGNHEFLNVVGHGVPDDHTRSLLHDTVQSAFCNDIIFDSKLVNGVNFVSFDNVNYNVSQDIFDKMKKEVAKGYPIVIICHIPIYIPETIQSRLDERGGTYASVMGAPNYITDTYTGTETSGAKYEQRASSVTLQFTEYLRGQSCIKAILCGHNHKKHTEQFSPSCKQYTMAASYDANMDVITFK